jgi:hypothetical protein|tara:strand:- start:829 stop:951 length:123 start_codon:yes stop_codon:yes gene_type:complete
MADVKVVSNGVEYEFEFVTAPSQDDINSAMDTIGGRPKRP